MSMAAEGHRHLATVRRGEKAWEWTALAYGHVQPIGYRNHHRGRRFWQIHITPIHIERDGAKWEIGICFGKRTLYLRVHR